MGIEEFVGAWKLVSWESTRADGTVTRPWGEAPVGLAVFTREGYATAQLMRPGRAPLSADGSSRPSAEAAAEAMRGYVAYFGRYEVDEASRTLATHVEASLLPDWIGGDQVRSYEFRNGRLVLKPPSGMAGGESVTNELVWERAEAGSTRERQ